MNHYDIYIYMKVQTRKLEIEIEVNKISELRSGHGVMLFGHGLSQK